MKKLSQNEAYAVLGVATYQRENGGFNHEKSDYHIRFGQALWNAMPTDMTQEYTGTDHDFFHWTDNKKVIDEFYSTFVDGEVR